MLSLMPFVNASASEATGGDGHIYRGKYTNYSDIIYTWDGKHVYRGKYTNYSDIMFTYDGKHLYVGKYTNYSDIIVTFDAPVPVIVMLLSVL